MLCVQHYTTGKGKFQVSGKIYPQGAYNLVVYPQDPQKRVESQTKLEIYLTAWCTFVLCTIT